MKQIRRATSIICAAFMLLAAISQARAATPISSCGTVIKTPGSYVATKNLTVMTGESACITVLASFVSIDLGGFTLDCGRGGSQAALGISDESNPNSGIVVRDGTLTNCTFSGIGLHTSTGILIDRVIAISNRLGTGINLGFGSLVIRGVSDDNLFGISFNCPSGAIDSTAVGNRSGDFVFAPGSPHNCDFLNDLAQQ